MEKLYIELAEILEEKVKRESVLEDFEEWDSLAVLSIMSMLEENFGVWLNGFEIKSVVTAGDIEDLIREKRAS